MSEFGKLGKDLYYGYNEATNSNSDMLMDIGIQLMDKKDECIFNDFTKEVAFVIITGKVEIIWNSEKRFMERNNVFDESPTCLHVPQNTKVKIIALEKSEILIQKTENSNDFPPKFYNPEDVRSDIFGEGVWGGTATRTVRTIFDYETAPYSNMVNGEVINSPGRWSSYIPHFHPQPEVYLYKFDKIQGFGGSFLGDNVYRIEHNSFVAIKGGKAHPQVTAPGYAMWYSWMIRHLQNDPWKKTRIVCKEHDWLEQNGAEEKIWHPKID